MQEEIVEREAEEPLLDGIFVGLGHHLVAAPDLDRALDEPARSAPAATASTMGPPIEVSAAATATGARSSV